MTPSQSKMRACKGEAEMESPANALVLLLLLFLQGVGGDCRSKREREGEETEGFDGVVVRRDKMGDLRWRRWLGDERDGKRRREGEEEAEAEAEAISSLFSVWNDLV